jgi:hypothetical protein
LREKSFLVNNATKTTSPRQISQGKEQGRLKGREETAETG